MGSKGQLIDVRQPEEFELGHIKNALLHSVENIENFKQSKIKLTISIVKVVIEVEKQVNFLHNADNVVNLDGGYTHTNNIIMIISFKVKEDRRN